MKKILVCLFALVLLAGCGGGQVAKKDVFTSIRDAITRQIALRCEYTDESGYTSTNYIKGQMIRVDSTANGQTTYALLRDEKIYIWMSGSKDGFVMDISGIKNSSDFKMGGKAIHSTDDIINTLEAEKNKCSAANVPDSYFEVPQGINFTDWSKLLNQMGK